VRAYVGLGSNLGDREATLRKAIELLGAEDGVEVVAVSTLRDTEPVGYVDQPRFLNGVAAVETELGPRDLLERLLAVERSLGRERSGPRFGPRTVDLDLLLHGDGVVDEPGLTVPHPRLAERAFVLEPLAELDPELRLPDGRRVGDLLAQS
jgi:2-amino-4-hydroxy-6-hydroxymethyldihydropteridine diphosphokinase